MYVLGINCIYHESAACLLDNGRMVAAVEEERFTRRKHAKTPQLDNPDILPLQSMRHCLEQAGIDLTQVAYIGYSSDPDARDAAEAWDDDPNMMQFSSNIRGVPENLRTMGFAGEFRFIDHHTAHAASAFYASPFEEAAVLTVDGIGDGNTTAGYHGRGVRMDRIWQVPTPHSIGFLWELTSMFLGFGIYDATKIMGLSAYGDAKRFRSNIEQLIHTAPDGQFVVDEDKLKFWKLDYINQSGYFEGLEEVFGMKKRNKSEKLEQAHYDIAAALQDVTDEILLHIVNELHRLTGSKYLAVAGGVALNCVSNARIFNAGPFEDLYIQAAAHDAGTAIGCATEIWHNELGNTRGEPMHHAYVGPEFTDTQIEEALKRHGLNYRRCEFIEREVAELLQQSEIVGWMQGRMEIGPRALGNRSLLADPRHPNMRDILNQKVKHREFFRPFAPSVLLEEAGNWFQLGKPASADEFMLMAYPVQDDKRDKIPAVVHADGTCRIQSVRKDTNPRYHRLISEFQKLTGVPIVLNTSFNDSEPIVCSPDDAIDTFLKTNIDNLAMGDFLVRKVDNPPTKRLPKVLPSTLHKTFPDLPARLEQAVGLRRVTRFNGLLVTTDTLGYDAADQVLPIFPEQQFFVDELDAGRVEGANVLEIGIGCGVLSMTMAQNRARRVVALEVNPRAKLLAGFNIVLNGFDSVIELRDGDADVFHPVKGETFDFIIANPPFIPAPANSDFYTHSAAGVYGLEFLEKIFRGLDAHLAETGRAQIVTISPGDEHGPSLLTDLISRHLRGRTTVRVNQESGEFRHMIDWLRGQGALDAKAAKAMYRRAKKDGVTHSHLCMLHYDRAGKKEVVVEPAARVYDTWELAINGVQLMEETKEWRED